MSIYVDALRAADTLGAICHAGEVQLSDDGVDVALVGALHDAGLVAITSVQGGTSKAAPTVVGIMFNEFRLRLARVEDALKTHRFG